MKLFEGINQRVLWTLVITHAVIIAASNFLVNYKFELLGQPLAWSTFVYPLTFVATDLTVRLTNKRMGRSVIGVSFIPATVLSIFTTMAAGIGFDDALRVAIASGFAYLVASLIDVYVFQFLRERYKQWWVAPGASGIFITIISTYIFFASAFIGSNNAFMSANWFTVATNGIITKMIVNTIIILPVYGIVLNYLLKTVNGKR